MKSIDSYLCREAERVHAFTFCGVDYFVGDALSVEISEFLYNYLESFWNQPISARVKLYRFAETRYVDCAL